MPKCIDKKASGQACKGDAMPGAVHCWAHDPANAEKRRRIASKGGKRGGRGRPGANAELTELKDQLKEMYEGVLAGNILLGIGAVANQIQNSRLRAVEMGRKQREQDELEGRLEALEEQLEAQLLAQGVSTIKRRRGGK